MKKTRPLFIVFLILSLISVSCMCGLTEKLSGLMDGNGEAEITIEVPDPGPDGLPEITGPEDNSDSLGKADRLENKEGGFSLAAPKKFTVESAFGMTTMQAPDFTEEAGPLLLAVGGRNEMEMSLDDLYDYNIGEMEDFTPSGKRKIEVAGKPAYEVDMAGAPDGVDIIGKYVVVAVSPMQFFIFGGFSEPDRWDSEIAPLYAATLKSVKFFKPDEEAFQMPTIIPDIPTVSQGELIKQWGIAAEASSEYEADEYSAMQATGPPDTPECGDHGTAWASLEKNTIEWLEVYYTTPVYPTEINIYQTHTPDQIAKVEVLSEDNGYLTVYEGKPSITACPYMTTVKIKNADYMTQAVRITIDQTKTGLP